jgi:hypothetical protein
MIYYKLAYRTLCLLSWSAKRVRLKKWKVPDRLATTFSVLPSPIRRQPSPALPPQLRWALLPSRPTERPLAVAFSLLRLRCSACRWLPPDANPCVHTLHLLALYGNTSNLHVWASFFFFCFHVVLISNVHSDYILFFTLLFFLCL